MTQPLRTSLAALLFGAITAIPAAAADDPHLRGEITAIDGAAVTIETASGQSVEVAMADDYTLLVYSPMDFADLHMNDYLAIPSIHQADGGKQAMAVIVFPEAMRGFAEGESAWDLIPGSRMTNASLAQITATTAGRELTVSYDGMSDTIAVPMTAPVVTFAPDPERRLEIGDNAILFAKSDGDGFTAGLAGISTDGTLPPL